MFSMGPSDPRAGFPARILPKNPLAFEQAWTAYYDALFELARHVLRAFAMTLQLDDQFFFDQFMDHHASALRAINYPAIKGNMLPGQLRASAHTDYGTITILKSDGPGLQVSKDKSPPDWYDVPHIEGGFIINLGDLMRRWTNDKWLSTLHRVVIPSSDVIDSWNTSSDSSSIEVDKDGNNAGEIASITDSREVLDTHRVMRRQSLAFFHNINSDAVVHMLLDSSSSEAPKHEPIVAGDFLMQKHLASIGVAASRSE